MRLLVAALALCTALVGALVSLFKDGDVALIDLANVKVLAEPPRPRPLPC